MPIPTAQERIGTQLAGRYEFRAMWARGGMGILFEGWDHRTERPVIIKLLRSVDLEDAGRRERFLLEARALCRVRHPHVVEVLDCGEDHDLPYLVMERLEGAPLSELLATRGALPLEECLELLLPVMGALAHSHDAGIVHRDIKPSNLFVHTDLAGRRVPKVLDFGIAKGLGETGLTATGVAVGTPEYMAPEQAAGEPVGPAADVWAMGVLWYRCLTGEAPFQAATPQALLARIVNGSVPPLAERMPSLPRRFAAAIDRALSPTPATRYPHMREMARALTTTAASCGVALPIQPDPLGLSEFASWRAASATPSLGEASAVVARVTERGQERKGKGWAAGLGLAAIAAAAAFWLSGVLRSQEPMPHTAQGSTAATRSVPAKPAATPDASPMEATQPAAAGPSEPGPGRAEAGSSPTRAEGAGPGDLTATSVPAPPSSSAEPMRTASPARKLDPPPRRVRPTARPFDIQPNTAASPVPAAGGPDRADASTSAAEPRPSQSLVPPLRTRW